MVPLSVSLISILALASLSLTPVACAALQSHHHLRQRQATTVHLHRRSRSPKDRTAALGRERIRFEAKYAALGGDTNGGYRRRSSGGVVPLSNAFADAEYFGEIEVGTPYHHSSAFSITYGSGDASGTLVTDTVAIGGYGMVGQTLAAATTSDDVVTGDISGLLGLGWIGLASSKATPLLQGLASSGTLPEAIFSFAFSRFVHDNAALSTIEPGGFLTIGGTNTSLYTGQISWNPLLSSTTPSYWLIPLQSARVEGSVVPVTGIPAVIDSGTSLIAGPASDIALIYSKVPNSQQTTVSGQQGYYSFPCSANISSSLTFGGVEYPISPEDFNAGQSEQSDAYCVGAFFVFNSASATGVSWIIGASFLKNVYSSFQFSPTPSVGFAQLSDAAKGLGGESGGGAVSSDSSKSTPTSTSNSVTSTVSTSSTARTAIPTTMFSLSGMGIGLSIGAVLGSLLVWLV